MKRTRVPSQQEWRLHLESEIERMSLEQLRELSDFVEQEIAIRERFMLIYWEVDDDFCNGLQLKKDSMKREQEWISIITTYAKKHKKWIIKEDVAQTDVDRIAWEFDRGFIRKKPKILAFSDLKPLRKIKNQESYMDDLFPED